MTTHLKDGDTVPKFRGVTEDGPIGDKDLLGTKYVLFFYPKDNTPGCTMEACAFRDAAPIFRRLKTKVLGVSKDSLASHQKFVDKYELTMPLISDEDGSICAAFGTFGEKTLYGKKYMGIERSTFLVDEKGILLKVWPKVKVAGHVEDVINSIKSIK